MFVCEVTLVLYPFTSLEFDMRSISSLRTWSIACWLALCTRFCLVFMTIDVYSEETTLTAILGNLELSTSVAIGVLFFGETYVNRLILGILFILLAVVVIVFGKVLHLRAVSHAHSRLRRWK